MRATELIIRKRDGEKLTAAEIRWFAKSCLNGTIPDYQIAAFLMAVYFKGLSWPETEALTDAFVKSGHKLDLSPIKKPTVDKHSTGGVGDKVSFVVHSLSAACGAAVPSMSGRGLGFTGGTLDKLESIPGCTTSLAPDQIIQTLQKAGICIFGQTKQITPLDRQWYALRDVTGTVDSLPLIVASIMSKKIAEGASALLLDVKCGSGALMRDLQSATKLAEALVRVGSRSGLVCRAVITDMSQPLGNAVGNAVEIFETIETLQGKNPGRFAELCLAQAGHMIQMAGLARSPEEGKRKAEKALASGKGFAAFRAMVEAQGGDPKFVDDPSKLLAVKPERKVKATKSGFVTKIAADEVGWISVSLGAGRAKASDKINPHVGILINKHIGDHVSKGEPLATVLAEEQSSLSEAVFKLAKAFTIESKSVQPPPLIHSIIEGTK